MSDKFYDAQTTYDQHSKRVFLRRGEFSEPTQADIPNLDILMKHSDCVLIIEEAYDGDNQQQHQPTSTEGL